MPNPYETASQQTQAPANQPAPQQAAPQQVPGTPESKIVPTDKSASNPQWTNLVMCLILSQR